MFGISPTSTQGRSLPRYYRCSGKDCTSSSREHRCSQRMTLAETLEAAVWGHIQQLLSDPEVLLAQFRDTAQHDEGGNVSQQTEADKLQAQLRRLDREAGRLVDAYKPTSSAWTTWINGGGGSPNAASCCPSSMSNN